MVQYGPIYLYGCLVTSPYSSVLVLTGCRRYRTGKLQTMTLLLWSNSNSQHFVTVTGCRDILGVVVSFHQPKYPILDCKLSPCCHYLSFYPSVRCCGISLRCISKDYYYRWRIVLSRPRSFPPYVSRGTLCNVSFTVVEHGSCARGRVRSVPIVVCVPLTPEYLTSPGIILLHCTCYDW